MENLDFHCTSDYTKDDIKKVQNRLLEMGKCITSVLEKHHIDYFLASGTLLGAVRHNGFIPWDDDFDLFLFDEQYDEAISCLRENLPSDMIVHDKISDPIYWPASAKVRDLNTKTNAILFPDDNEYRYTGLNVDLYRLKLVQRDFVDAHRKKEHIEFLVRKHESKMLNDEYYLEKFIQWTREFSELIEVYHRKPEHDMNDCVYSHYGDFKRCEVSDVFPLRRYKFEGELFWGPNHYQPVLKEIYGDYLSVPAFEKRKPHYTSVVFLKEEINQ